jgi:hypothetical protein
LFQQERGATPQRPQRLPYGPTESVMSDEWLLLVWPLVGLLPGSWLILRRRVKLIHWITEFAEVNSQNFAQGF